jgi:hypothetical protein
MRTCPLLVAVLCASCAHVAEQAPVVADEPAPIAAVGPVASAHNNSVVINARDFVSAGQCASAAQELFARAPKPGWALLVACVGRADFNDLEALVDEPWANELRKRTRAAEGAQLVARVIARRGGNIDRDLRVCRRAGLRLYSLRAALADPEAMMGGFVVMRASIADARRVRGARAVELDETRPMTDDDIFFADDELVRRRLRRSSEALDELSVETGQSVVARVDPDAIYEPAIDYVMLLRFDGEVDVPHARGATKSAIGTVLASFEPELSLLSWLPQR